MNRKFKRNKQNKVQTNYIYKPSSSFKNEEKKVVLRLIMLVLLIIGFAVVLYLWGTDLVAYIGNTQINPSIINQSPKINKKIIAPRLSDLPSLINTKQITISGVASSKSEVEIFVNNISVLKVLVNEDGTFNNSNIDLIEGENTIYAISHDQNQVSDMSNILTIELDTQKPILTYTTSKNEETKVVTFSGSVKSGSSLYINDRRIILLSDNTFTIEYNLNMGENEYALMVEDQAGNQNAYTEKIQLAN